MDISGSRRQAQKQKPQLSKDEIVQMLKQRTQNHQRPQSQPSSSTPKPSPPPPLSAKKKSKKSRKPKKEGFKIVIRLLPPQLAEEALWKKLQLDSRPVSAQNGVMEKYFVQGKYSTKPFKEPKYSRAYVQFRSASQAEKFVGDFRGTVFEDENESMVPVFAQSLYDRMHPRMQDFTLAKGQDSPTNSAHKSLLADQPSFKLFLKVLNGEVERPESFLKTTKKEDGNEGKSHLSSSTTSVANVSSSNDTKKDSKRKSVAGDAKDKNPKNPKKRKPKQSEKKQKESSSRGSSTPPPNESTKLDQKKKKPTEKKSSEKKKPEKKQEAMETKRPTSKSKSKPSRQPTPTPTSGSENPITVRPKNPPKKETPPTSDSNAKPQSKMLLRRPTQPSP